MVPWYTGAPCFISFLINKTYMSLFVFLHTVKSLNLILLIDLYDIRKLFNIFLINFIGNTAATVLLQIFEIVISLLVVKQIFDWKKSVNKRI